VTNYFSLFSMVLCFFGGYLREIFQGAKCFLFSISLRGIYCPYLCKYYFRYFNIFAPLFPLAFCALLPSSAIVFTHLFPGSSSICCSICNSHAQIKLAFGPLCSIFVAFLSSLFCGRAAYLHARFSLNLAPFSGCTYCKPAS